MECIRFCVFIFLLFVLWPTSASSQGHSADWTYYNTSNSNIPSNRISSVEVDSDGSIWVGTYNAGIAKFDGTDWTVFNTTNSGITDNNINHIYIDGHIVWLRSNQGGNGDNLIKFDGSNWNTYTQFGFINSVSFDDQHNAWIATQADGLLKFDGNTIERFDASTSCLYQNAITASYIDPSNNLKWVGMYGGFVGEDAGLVKMSGNNCTVYNMQNSGFPADNWTYNIFRDPVDHNAIWVNTNNGTAKFDGVNWTTLQYPASSGSPAVGIDSTYAFWIGTIFSGSARYTDHWEIFNGLPDSGINGMVIGPDNRVWMATESKGLAVFQNSTTAITPLIKNEDKIICRPTIVDDELTVFWNTVTSNACNFRIYSLDSKITREYSLQPGKNVLDLNYQMPLGVYFYIACNERNEILASGKLIFR